MSKTQTEETMTHVTVKFLRPWANSCTRTWAAGDLFTRRGKSMVNALARLADWASCCWEVRADGTYLVQRIGSGDPVAVVANVRTATPEAVADRMAEMDVFTR